MHIYIGTRDVSDIAQQDTGEIDKHKLQQNKTKNNTVCIVSGASCSSNLAPYPSHTVHVEWIL